MLAKAGENPRLFHARQTARRLKRRRASFLPLLINAYPVRGERFGSLDSVPGFPRLPSRTAGLWPRSALVPYIRPRVSSEIIFCDGALVTVALLGRLLLFRPDPPCAGVPLEPMGPLTRELAQTVAGKSCIGSRYAAVPCETGPNASAIFHVSPRCYADGSGLPQIDPAGSATPTGAASKPVQPSLDCGCG